MNALIQAGAEPVTMTSLELVDFINAQRKEQAGIAGASFPSSGFARLAHSDFMKKVPEVLGGGAGNFSDTHVNTQNGQTYPCYRFPKREACLMAMSYSYDLQAKVFDKMTALETGGAPAVNVRDPRQLAAVAMQLIEVNAELQQTVDAQQRQIDVVAPKAAALDRLARETDGAVCLRVAAKLTQVPEKHYLQFLREQNWIFRHHHAQTWQGYADKEKAGYLELKRTRVTRDDGSEKTVEQVLITPRGLAKAAELIERIAPWLRKDAAPAPILETA